MSYVNTPFVKIFTGVRRCGKSTILHMIMKRLREERGIPAGQIVSYRFDSMEYEDMTAQQMYQKLKGQLSKSGTTYLFLTERREYECLLEIRDNYPKYVLRADELSGVNYEGILTMHVADFLLRTPQPSVELLPVYREEMRMVVIELI